MMITKADPIVCISFLKSFVPPHALRSGLHTILLGALGGLRLSTYLFDVQETEAQSGPYCPKCQRYAPQSPTWLPPHFSSMHLMVRAYQWFSFPRASLAPSYLLFSLGWEILSTSLLV